MLTKFQTKPEIIYHLNIYFIQIYLDDLKSHNDIYCEKYEKNGETYLRIKKHAVKFNPAKVKLRFENLFDGNKELGIY